MQILKSDLDAIRTSRIAHIGVASQILLNQLHDLFAEGLFERELKSRAKLFISELKRVERKTFDDWLESDAESQAESIYDIYDAFLKDMAKVKINEMPAMQTILKAYRKDPKSIEGICKKILK